MALPFTEFNVFYKDLGLAKHNLDVDDLAVALSNVLPVVTNLVLTDITEIAAGNGYVAGGPTLVANTWTQDGVITQLFADDLMITAAGGVIGPFRYPVLYNKTHAAKPLIGWWTRATSLTLNAGESWLLDISSALGILQIGAAA